MSTSVTDRDLGYAKALKALAAFGEGAGVYVGVRAAAGSDMVIIAASNEFGTEDGHIPERSYLRSTVDHGQSEVADDLQAATEAAIDGTMALPTGLARVGAKWVGKVQQTMRDFTTPKNADATIAKKGVDNPLIDTGRLRQSIDYEVKQ